MSDWDLSTRFSGLSLSTQWDNFYDPEEEEPVRWKSFYDPEFYGNVEDGEEELVGWDCFYENVEEEEEEEEELVGWDSFYENVEEEELELGLELGGWESFYDPEFYENFEQGEEEEVINGVVGQERWIKHYSSSHKILLVGEGDFSFSASLAMAFGSAPNMIATSLDSRDFLRRHYGRAIPNIIYLTSKGCRVMHGVDATEMAENPLLQGRKFDRIVFNFPFAGFFKTESREYQLSKHKRLVRLFLKNAKKMINESGQIHITHKTNAFHCEWNLETLAYVEGLRLIEAVDFDCTDFPGYANKYGFGGDNGFNCNPSKTYKFGHLPQT